MYYIFTYYGINDKGMLSVFLKKEARDSYEWFAKRNSLKTVRVTMKTLEHYQNKSDVVDIEYVSNRPYDENRDREMY